MRAVQRPFALRGEKIALSVSVGAALSAPHDDADSLLANADRALYAAKAAGGDGWRLAVSG